MICYPCATAGDLMADNLPTEYQLGWRIAAREHFRIDENAVLPRKPEIAEWLHGFCRGCDCHHHVTTPADEKKVSTLAPTVVEASDGG